MLEVEVCAEGESPRLVRFDDARSVTFGRAPSNDIVLPAAYVSRVHGELRCVGGCWFVVDGGSQAGIELVRRGAGARPERLPPDEPHPLRGGEKIWIRDSYLSIELKSLEPENPATGTETHWRDLSVSRIAEADIADAGAMQNGLERDSHKLNLLLDLSKDLNARDLNEVDALDAVFERVSETVFEVLPSATHLAVCTPGPDGDLEPHFAILKDGSRASPEEVGVSSSIMEMVVERERAMLYCVLDGEISPSASMVLHSIGSAMAVPLRGAHGTSGVMMVDNRSTVDPFGTPDLDFAVVLAQHVASALERAQHRNQIAAMFDGFVEASVTAIEARDPTTSGHSRRVADYSIALCQAVDGTAAGPFHEITFSREQLTEMGYAALLHDFGKVAVRECVLLKPQRLYPEQLERIESRFQLIAAMSRVAAFERALGPECSEGGSEEHEAGGEGRDGEARLRIAAEVEEAERRLAAELAFIGELNGGRPLLPEDAERVRVLAAMRFVDTHARERAFLLEDELEALQIPRGTLTDAQRLEIQAHVAHSFQSLSRIPWSASLAQVPDLVHMHHEKLDGTGYPRGIEGAAIPVEARILTVCDIFDALTASDRPYRSAMPPERGLEQLRNEAGRGQIDSDLVELFIGASVWERPRTAGGTSWLSRGSRTE